MSKLKIAGIILLAIALLILAAYSDQLIRTATYGSGGTANVGSAKKHDDAQNNKDRKNSSAKSSLSQNHYEKVVKETDYKNKQKKTQKEKKKKDLTDKLNKDFKKIYITFFKTLKRQVDTYNKESDTRINYYIPEFKDSIYSTQDKMNSIYTASIKFNKDTFWNINLFHIPPVVTKDIPNILIRKSDKQSINLKQDPVFSILFSIEDHVIALYHNTDKTDLKKYYPLEKPEEAFREILNQILKYQINHLN